MSDTAVVAGAISQVFVGLALVLIARNMLQLWIRFKEDQAAIERSRRSELGGTLELGVAQPVPRGTNGVANGHGELRGELRGNRERLSALSRPGDVVLPDDLEAHCAQWEDSWARDDERAVVRGKFVELFTGDSLETWQRVRRAVGIGELP